MLKYESIAELVQAAVNRRERPDLDEIDRQLEKEKEKRLAAIPQRSQAVRFSPPDTAGCLMAVHP